MLSGSTTAVSSTSSTSLANDKFFKMLNEIQSSTSPEPESSETATEIESDGSDEQVLAEEPANQRAGLTPTIVSIIRALVLFLILFLFALRVALKKYRLRRNQAREVAALKYKLGPSFENEYDLTHPRKPNVVQVSDIYMNYL